MYQSAMDEEVFNVADIANYVKAYSEAEQAAFNRESELDALLSNINQDYKAQFVDFYPEVEDQKAYIAILNRYIKLYYFIAQFFELEARLHEFIVFAEVMAASLIKKGKTSELKLLLKNLEVSKGGLLLLDRLKMIIKHLKNPLQDMVGVVEMASLKLRLKKH